MILFAGALLLTPGFFTDALGLSLMVPMVRRAVFAKIRTRMETIHIVPDAPARGQDDIIDGTYEDITPPSERLPPRNGH